MASEIFKLFGSVFIDDKSAIDSLNNVDTTAGKTGSSLGSMIGTAAKWGAGIAVGVGGAVAGLLGLASAASDTASEIADMSVRTGLSTTRLQELKFASEQSGVNFESLGGAVAKLTKNMGAADEGGKKAQEAFEKLGISTKDAATGGLKSMDDIFPQVLEKLGNITNETERNALATKLFGGSATELVPLLEQGGAGIAALSDQAHQLGLVLDESTIAAGDEFGDSLDAIKSGMGGVVTAIGAELMPKFQVIFDWVLAHMPEIQATIGGAFDVAGAAIGGTVDVVQALTGFFIDHWAIMEPILAGIAAGGLVFGIYTIAINAAAWATSAWTAITGVATTVGAAFGAVMAFITSPIGIVILAIGLLIAAGVLLYKNWDTVSKFLGDKWKWIQDKSKEVFNAVVEFFKEHWKLILGIFTGPIGLLVALIIDNWDLIKEKSKTAWDAIVDVIRGPVNLILGFANSIIGGYESMLNAVAKIINKIPDVSIPDWVPGLGGKTFGIPDISTINLPRIPMLEKGTDFFEGGMAIVGEKGPELVEMPRGSKVTPHKETTELLEKDPVHVHLYIDGKEVTTSTSRPSSDAVKNRGRGSGTVIPA